MASEKVANVIIECLKNKEVQDEFRKLLDEQSQKITGELKQCYSCEKLRDIDSLRIRISEYESKVNEVENSKIQLGLKIQSLEQDIKDFKDRESSQIPIIENYIQNVQALNQQLSNQKNICEEKQKQLINLHEEIQSFRTEIENYKSLTGSIKLVMEKYLAMGDSTKRQLSNIFRSIKSGAFMAAGSQWQNIEGLWNYIQRKVIEGDNSDTAALTDVFIFFFNNYKEMFDTPIYELISPRAGDRYDSDYHSILGTKTDGIVANVKLAGYVNNKTKKVNKALIEV